ncbi:MAG TPA: hypothetical protein VHN77_08780, partial [Phycisphaerales bacterium]|nr:hypothetical protein [Phycisphaerales bacterium]
MKKSVLVSASLLATLAGQASAQFTVDGLRSGPEPYTQVWVNNQPTSYGDSEPFIGVSGNPEDAVNGIEIAIPFAALGITSGAGGLKLNAVLGNGSNLSNQVIAADGLPANSAALGAGNAVNFTTIAGNQFVSLSAAQLTPVATAPVMDGVLDGGQINGVGGVYENRRVALNSNYTSLGGSEINGTFAVVYDNATPGDTSDDILHLFITGNNANFNRLAIFLDAVAGGQNRLLNGNANWGFGFVPGISASSPTATNGLTFDAGFEPEAMIIFNSDTATGYTDWVTIPTGTPDGLGGITGVGSAGTYLGSTGASGPGTLAGGNNAIGLQVSFNNLNTGGVSNTPAGLISPDHVNAFGSELDNVWAFVDAPNDRLHLFVGGNLENNFNSLVMFFDVNATDGQNQLKGVADLVPNPFLDANNGLNRMGNGGNNAVGAGTGLRFEPGFTADYVVRLGNDATQIYANAVVIRSGGRQELGGYQTEFTAYSGGDRATNEPITFPGTFAECQPFSSATDPSETNSSPRFANANNDLTLSPCDVNNQIAGAVLSSGYLVVALDNSNAAGVTGDGAAVPSVSGAAAVASGAEFSLKLSELGWNGTDPIKVTGFIGSGDYGNVSNQIFGGIDGGFFVGNLGESSALDLTAVPGVQELILSGTGGPVCDTIDFNNDGLFPDTMDIDDFLSVFSGGPCSNDPNCGDIDYNNDGL